MKIHEEIFRTYDIRGKFPDQFSSETALKISQAFGTFFTPGKNIVIGGDVRISTPVIKNILSAGLMETGCNVLDVGICTTPTIYFLAARNPEIDGGVMITASHNPIDYNGIKVCDERGVSYHIDNFFTRIKRIIEQKTIRTVKNTEYGQPVLLEGVDISQYWQFQRSHFNPKQSFNLAVEIGNGTCYPIIELLESAKMKVQPFHSKPDGNFPVMIPDPAKPSCLRFIQDAVKKNKLDIGIGFDADGDRVGFVDDQGEIVRPDQVIMLFGKHLLQKYPKCEIMIDVKTSKATFEYLSELGAKVTFTRVGHSWIHETLLGTGAIFAGELSGHYYFGADYYGFDDAIYSALKMLEILSALEQTFSELIKNFPNYSTSEEFRVPCPEKIKSLVVKNLKDQLKKDAERSITVDGIRAEFEDGWILIRESGTEPVISIRAEAYSNMRLEYYQELAKELVTNEIQKLLKKKVKEQ